MQKPEDYFGLKAQAFGYILLYVGQIVYNILKYQGILSVTLRRLVN